MHLYTRFFSRKVTCTSKSSKTLRTRFNNSIPNAWCRYLYIHCLKQCSPFSLNTTIARSSLPYRASKLTYKLELLQNTSSPKGTRTNRDKWLFASATVEKYNRTHTHWRHGVGAAYTILRSIIDRMFAQWRSFVSIRAAICQRNVSIEPIYQKLEWIYCAMAHIRSRMCIFGEMQNLKHDINVGDVNDALQYVA